MSGTGLFAIRRGARSPRRSPWTARACWWVEGEEDARLRGCTDVDLEISPSTNTIPIRRLNLAVGQASAVTAAWVRFPALTVEPLTQRYTRTGANRYHYASGAFATEIEVDDVGLVTGYEGGWVREAETLLKPAQP